MQTPYSSPVLTDRDTPRSWIASRYVALDGLRGIAILMVFIHHYQPFSSSSILFWGWTGVDIFFVLSGFLITGILYDSLHGPDYFKNFYIRRTLRIFPLFYGLWLVLGALSLFIHASWNQAILTNLLYISNWFPNGVGVAHLSPFTLLFRLQSGRGFGLSFNHFWTLCIEEQFYLAWPLVLFLVKDRKKLMRLCIIVCGLVLALRIYLFFHVSPQQLATNFLYSSTYTRIDTLLVGAWFALWLRGVQVSPRRLRKLALWLIFAPLGIIVLGHNTLGRFLHINTFTSLVCTYEFTLIALMGAGLLLLTLDTSTRTARVMMHPRLTKLGRISYGFYILHYLPHSIDTTRLPLHFAFHMHPTVHIVWVSGIFALSYALASLSFRYFETPILRLKNWFAPPHSAALPTAAVTVAVAVAAYDRAAATP